MQYNSLIKSSNLQQVRLHPHAVWSSLVRTDRHELLDHCFFPNSVLPSDQKVGRSIAKTEFKCEIDSKKVHGGKGSSFLFPDCPVFLRVYIHTPPEGGGLKNRSWVDLSLVDVVFHKSRGRCIRSFTYQVNRVHQITKRTLGLAEGLRKLVAGALLGYYDKVTKTSPFHRTGLVTKTARLGSRLGPGHRRSPGSKTQSGLGSRLSPCHGKQTDWVLGVALAVGKAPWGSRLSPAMKRKRIGF